MGGGASVLHVKKDCQLVCDCVGSAVPAHDFRAHLPQAQFKPLRIAFGRNDTRRLQKRPPAIPASAIPGTRMHEPATAPPQSAELRIRINGANSREFLIRFPISTKSPIRYSDKSRPHSGIISMAFPTSMPAISSDWTRSETAAANNCIFQPSCGHHGPAPRILRGNFPGLPSKPASPTTFHPCRCRFYRPQAFLCTRYPSRNHWLARRTLPAAFCAPGTSRPSARPSSCRSAPRPESSSTTPARKKGAPIPTAIPLRRAFPVCPSTTCLSRHCEGSPDSVRRTKPPIPRTGVTILLFSFYPEFSDAIKERLPGYS